MTSAAHAYAPSVPRTGIRASIHDTAVMTVRNLRRYQRQPQIAVFVFIQPVMFVLLFRYVFGGSIEIPGLDYVNFLMPGIIVQSVTFSTVGTSIGIAEDLKAGIIDRFRSLPMSHASVLAGRVFSDTAVTTMTVVVMAVVGYLVGWRITTSPLETLLAFAGVLAFGFSFSWIAAWIGLTLKEPEAVQSAGFVWLFPVAFASSVFVFPANLPSWLQGFAEQNPLTRVSNSVRILTVDGYPCVTETGPGLCADLGPNLFASMLWALAIVAVFVPLAARGWQRLD